MEAAAAALVEVDLTGVAEVLATADDEVEDLATVDDLATVEEEREDLEDEEVDEDPTVVVEAHVLVTPWQLPKAVGDVSVAVTM